MCGTCVECVCGTCVWNVCVGTLFAWLSLYLSRSMRNVSTSRGHWLCMLLTPAMHRGRAYGEGSGMVGCVGGWVGWEVGKVWVGGG